MWQKYVHTIIPNSIRFTGIQFSHKRIVPMGPLSHYLKLALFFTSVSVKQHMYHTVLLQKALAWLISLTQTLLLLPGLWHSRLFCLFGSEKAWNLWTAAQLQLRGLFLQISLALPSGNHNSSSWASQGKSLLFCSNCHYFSLAPRPSKPRGSHKPHLFPCPQNEGFGTRMLDLLLCIQRAFSSFFDRTTDTFLKKPENLWLEGNFGGYSAKLKHCSQFTIPCLLRQDGS